MSNRHRKGAIVLASALCACMGLFAVGCAADGAQPDEGPVSYLPEIVERDDGTLVQRTPSETINETALDGSYVYYYQSEETVASYPFNTYYLDADSRGCNSCHDDLADTLNHMEWSHVDLTNDYGIQITVQMCLDCHTFGYGYMTNQNSFGSLIHGIHAVENGESDCWSCHAAVGSGEGMQLWDEVKHSQLRGIAPVTDVQGDFSYDQDTITPNESLFDFGWLYYDNDYLRADKTAEGAQPDQETFDNWTITVSGEVDKETTYTLPELLEQLGAESTVATFHCTLNPAGGPLIQNCEYTGISLQALLDAVGVADGATKLQILSSDGFVEVVDIDKADNALLATEVNGEVLPWAQGYPVQLVMPGSAAPAWVKEVSDIIVMTEEDAAASQEWNGWPKENEEGDNYLNYYTVGHWPFVDESTEFVNKPGVAIFDFEEGQIVKTGEPYEFAGYATAYDETIAAIEFSMDGGITWTSFEVSDVTNERWVNWRFAYTPEADAAYVLSVRAVTDTGRVSDEPAEIMFNAKSE